jgi:hypothetical protein
MEEMDFESVRQAKELFNQCRYLYQKLLNSNKGYMEDNNNQTSKNDIILNNKIIKKRTTMFEEGIGVGELESKTSFGLGIAGKDAKPTNRCKLYIFKKI